MSNKEKNILIADDHSVVRMGLSMVLKKIRPLASIKEVDDYQKVFNCISSSSFDLIILDINMPNGSFQDTLELIKIKHPATKVLVFSSQDESIYAIRYLKMGADGFLHKLSTEKEMTLALENMLNKGQYLSDPIKNKLIFQQLNKEESHENPLEVLSDREIAVAKLLMKGLPLKEISQDLNLHTSTVSTYKTRIFKKLDIQSVPELIRVFSLFEAEE